MNWKEFLRPNQKKIIIFIIVFGLAFFIEDFWTSFNRDVSSGFKTVMLAHLIRLGGICYLLACTLSRYKKKK